MGLQLTRGAEYAVRAMTYLARYPEGHVASLHEIGEAQDIPESFLAKILQSLVRAGLTMSQRGAHGGFSLARPASEITMQQVIEAVDGPISVNHCVLSPDDCARSASCTVHAAWLRAQDQLMDVLGSITLESLAPTPTPVSS
jgi:Rrf2 family transcriptional regulator, iron-sulfur cluster assembly transcription factor